MASSPFLVRCRVVGPVGALALSRSILPVVSAAFPASVAFRSALLQNVAFQRAVLQKMGVQRMGVIQVASETSGMRVARVSIEQRMSELSSCRRCK